MPKIEAVAFHNDISRLMPYALGHTDQMGTMWEGTLPGCEYQEAGITGGHLGGWTPYVAKRPTLPSDPC